MSELGGENRISELFSQALDQQVTEDRKMQNLLTEVRSAVARIEDATGEALRGAVRTSVQATAGPAVDGAVARTMGPGLAEIRTAIDALNARLDEIVVRLDAQADAIGGLPSGVEMDAVGLSLASLRTSALTREDVAQVVQDKTGANDMSLVLADMNQQLSSLRAELHTLNKPAPSGPDVSVVVAEAVAASETRLRASIDVLRDAQVPAPSSPPPVARVAPMEVPEPSPVTKRFDPLSDPLPTTLRFQADPEPIPAQAPQILEVPEFVERLDRLDKLESTFEQEFPAAITEKTSDEAATPQAEAPPEAEPEGRKRRWFRREDAEGTAADKEPEGNT